MECALLTGIMLSYHQLTTIPLCDTPGWVTFSIDGKCVFPASGEVIVARLQDEFYNKVESEKMVEIDFENNKAVKACEQFGIGRWSK